MALLAGLLPLLGVLGLAVPAGPARVLRIALAVLAGLGLLAGVFLGSGRYAAASVRAEEALAWLAGHGAGGDPADRRRYAVALLLHAFVSDGPTTSHTFEFAQARDHLGATLPYVLEVEAVLRQELSIYPVFTSAPDTP